MTAAAAGTAGGDPDLAHVGAAVTDRLFELEWITRGVVPRSVQVTAEGEGGMAELLAAAQPETVIN